MLEKILLLMAIIISALALLVALFRSPQCPNMVDSVRNALPRVFLDWVGASGQFTHWVEGEPNNSGGYEQCLHANIFNKGRWNDISCDAKHRALCRSKIDGKLYLTPGFHKHSDRSSIEKDCGDHGQFWRPVTQGEQDELSRLMYREGAADVALNSASFVHLPPIV